MCREGVSYLAIVYYAPFGSRFLARALTAVHCYTIVQFLYTVLFEVTVNTCTCTDVFTTITTEDQSGGVYSTGDQGFMAVSKQTLSSDSVCLLP